MTKGRPSDPLETALLVMNFRKNFEIGSDRISIFQAENVKKVNFRNKDVF